MKIVIVLQKSTLAHVQVNLWQKLSYLNKLTHFLTRDCSLNYKKNTTSEHIVYKHCFECQNKNQKKTIFVYNMLWTCIFSCNSMNNLLSFNLWFKNESFWHRFTCMSSSRNHMSSSRNQFMFNDAWPVHSRPVNLHPLFLRIGHPVFWKLGTLLFAKSRLKKTG